MKIIICALLFVFVVNIQWVEGRSANSAVNSTAIECRGLGDYCQYHIDCCSKNCRTYSYKCVRSFKEIPQVGQATMPQLQPVAEGGILTIQPVNSIDELVNRFGNDGNESMPSTETPTITTITMSNSSLLHATNQNKNRNNNMYFGITTPIVCLASGLRCSSSDECCSMNCSSDRCVIIEQSACVANGQKCYRAAECCSGRCHSFLNQCVS